VTIDPIYLPVQVSNPIRTPAPPALPEVSTPPVPSLAEADNVSLEVVLVSGVNYPKKRGKIQDLFSDYCKRIAPKLHKKYHGVKITVFNFFDGTQQEYQFRGDTLVQPVVIQNVGKLKDEHYRFVVDEDDDAKEKYAVTAPSKDDTTLYFPGISDIHATDDVKKKDYLKAFRDDKLKEKSLSVSDIYRYIENLGKSAKGSLVELHLFSHAYAGGPVFVNTKEFYEWDAAASKWNWFNDKKYLDKDGRKEDFDSGITIIKNVSDFRAAFADNGFSMVWGCNAYSSPKQIINQTTKSKHYKEMLKDPDKKLLELEFNSDDWDEDTADEFHELVLDTAPYSTGNKSEKKSLNDIKKILQPILDDTYMKKMAQGTGKDVLGALPGTYTNLDQKYQSKFGIRLMHVPLGKDYNDYIDDKDFSKGYVDFRAILKFYKDHLGVEFKPDGEYDKKTYGRGYAAYKA
jgi:hypothetical protein